MILDGFIKLLADSPPSALIGAHNWITPAVQTVHIVAIAVVMAAILMTNLKALGALGGDATLEQFSESYLPWIKGALLVLLVSGSILIIGEPKRSLDNPVFGLKMACLLVALTLTAIIHAPLRRESGFWTAPARRIPLRGLAAVSLTLWTAIIFAGRWIAYAVT